MTNRGHVIRETTMSISFTDIEDSHEVYVKTHPGDVIPGVKIGDHQISMEDACKLMFYVLGNTDLEGSDDPRIPALEMLKQLEIGEGHNTGNKRIRKAT